MNVSQQISELIESGMTQELIAEKSKRKQYTVSRLATKATKHPRFDDAKAIDDLHKFVVIDGNHWDDYDVKESVTA